MIMLKFMLILMLRLLLWELKRIQLHCSSRCTSSSCTRSSKYGTARASPVQLEHMCSSSEDVSGWEKQKTSRLHRSNCQFYECYCFINTRITYMLNSPISLMQNACGSSWMNWLGSECIPFRIHCWKYEQSKGGLSVCRGSEKKEEVDLPLECS